MFIKIFALVGVGEVDNIYDINRSWSLSAYPPYLIETWQVTGSVSSQTPREPPLNFTTTKLSLYKKQFINYLRVLPTFFEVFVFLNREFTYQLLQNYFVILLIFKITVIFFLKQQNFLLSIIVIMSYNLYQELSTVMFLLFYKQLQNKTKKLKEVIYYFV